MLLYYISSSFKNSEIFDKADKRHENMIFRQVDANFAKIVVKFDSDSNTYQEEKLHNRMYTISLIQP